jgi:hypothetical protein
MKATLKHLGWVLFLLMCGLLLFSWAIEGTRFVWLTPRPSYQTLWAICLGCWMAAYTAPKDNS